jgi:phosphatidylserine/phosphatidylglycerophosphate/cardiolipin synthase-like enzyme
VKQLSRELLGLASAAPQACAADPDVDTYLGSSGEVGFVAATLRALSDSPLVFGNQTHLLMDGRWSRSIRSTRSPLTGHSANGRDHREIVVIDSVWTAIDSPDRDRRSVVFNNEVDAIILGSNTAGQVEALLQRDMAASVAVTRDAWEKRAFTQRVHELKARV